MPEESPDSIEYLREVNERVSRIARELDAQAVGFRAALSASERERERLMTEVSRLERELSRRDVGANVSTPHASASTELALSDGVADLSRQITDLASLYVTSARLLDASDRDEVFTVITEVVVSLVGSECFGFFELGESCRTLEPSIAYGIDEAHVAWACSIPDALVTMVRDGEIVLPTDHQSQAPRKVSALVPFRFHGATMGILIVFDLLPHKRLLGHSDVVLLELLSKHAAMALLCADAITSGDTRRLRAAAPSRLAR